METPKHIKYLSIIFFINAAVSGLIAGMGLISLLGSTFKNTGSSGNNPNQIGIFLTQYGLSILVTTIAIFVLIYLGLSLQKLKPWARSLTLIYSLLTIVFFVISLFTGEINLSIGVFIQLYAVWVLTRPDVKAAFADKKSLTSSAPDDLGQ